MTPIPWDDNLEKCYSNKNIEIYDNALKDVSRNNDCFYVDIDNILNSEDMEDGLHPNPQGHKKIFELLRDFLIKNKII